MKKEILSIKKLVLASLFLAFGQILPFFTAQIPQTDLMMLPVYIPVFLCGYICGCSNGLIVGFITPIMRSVLFGLPPMVPYAVAMSFELAIYGFLVGYLCRMLPPIRFSVYITIILAMVAGRFVWGILFILLTGAALCFTTWFTIMCGIFLFTVIGIVVQMVSIPLIIAALRKTKVIH